MNDNKDRFEEFKKSLIEHFENILGINAKPYLRGHVFNIPPPTVVDAQFIIDFLNCYQHKKGTIWSGGTGDDGNLKIYAEEKDRILAKVHIRYGSDYFEIFIL